MTILDAISAALEKIAWAIATVILLIVFLLVLSGVVFRIVNFRFAMYEELSRWGLVGMTFIGASAALKQKLHVGINMAVQAMPLGIGKVCIAVAYLGIIAALCVAGYSSFKTALAAAGMTGDIVPVPMMYIKFTLPLGMFMIVFHLLAGFVKIFRAKEINSVLIGS